MTVTWPPETTRLIDPATAVGPAPVGWLRLRDQPLVVLVGLTGAGKTTLSSALSAGGRVTLLPDRRQVTDAVILGDRADQLDRPARFAATARFRDSAPGGMGEILAAISVRDHAPCAWLFDGLRGAAEVGFFAAKAPRALFLALSVPDEERSRRIATRADRFDGAASGSGLKAAALVAEEAKHYNLEETLSILATCAPERTVKIDAGRLSASDVLIEAEAALAAAFG